jgi:hypothetical protein
MEIYECSCCQFSTTIQGNYKRHLTTKKHNSRSEPSKNHPEPSNNHPEPSKNHPEPSKLSCKHCSKPFTCKNSMYRHIKHRCTKQKEDVKELTQLVNIQSEKIKQLETRLLTQQPQNVQIQINNIHYNLLPYQKTDTSHLTDEDFIQCVKQQNCVKHLIEKIHFNPTKPENMNIMVSNLKDKYMRIYDGEWRTIHKKQLNKIYGDKKDMICEWIEEEKYPKLKERFMVYLNQTEDDESLNQMKEEIKLMMYNQKRLTIGE